MENLAVVVPTLFDRPGYLEQCLKSLSNEGVYILLMGPNVEACKKEILDICDSTLEEPEVQGLSAKLQVALSSLPEAIIYATWIGDDDLLAPGAKEEILRLFSSNPGAALVVGGCEYIDDDAKILGTNRNFKNSIAFSRWGPFLTPQPGSAFRRSAFDKAGGLDSGYDLAFDYDLFLRLDRLNYTVYSEQILGKFRWHQGSLTVSNRCRSACEGIKIRWRNSKGITRAAVAALSPFVFLATVLAGYGLDLVYRFRRIAKLSIKP